MSLLKTAYKKFLPKKAADWYSNDLEKFVEKSLLVDRDRFDLQKIQSFPCLSDKTSTTVFDTHYIYHPAWAARIVRDIAPPLHIDISSTLHFCSILSAFIPTKFYDYRPANLNLSSLSSGAADLTQLPFKDNEIDSLSCMHTIEHIGLGRYGDPIDPCGDIKAMKELQRVVKPGGSLLLVTPVGRPKIAFNAHRIYSYELIVQNFNFMEVVEFSLIPDNAIEVGIINNCPVDLVKEQDYGCGCFWLRKKVI
jgi:hypothetical protein